MLSTDNMIHFVRKPGNVFGDQTILTPLSSA